MLTKDGFQRQINGLGMGSPPASMLANGWLSLFDSTINGDARIIIGIMDDVLREIKTDKIDETLTEINGLNDNLKFTMEK